MRQILAGMLILFAALAGRAMALSSQDAMDGATHLRNALVDAVNQRDYDHLVSRCHPELKLILSNSQVFHSVKELQSFIQSPDILGGLNIDSLRINEVNIDKNYVSIDSQHLIFTGTALFEYHFKRDKIFVIPTVWLAHIVKTGDTWLLLTYQNTVNITHNPVISDLKRHFYFIGIIIFILGIIFGILWKKVKKRG